MVWVYHQLIAMILVCLICGIVIWRKFGWLSGLAFMYVTVSAAFVHGYPESIWGPIQNRIDSVSGITCARVLAYGFIASHLTNKGSDIGFRGLEILAMIDAVVVTFLGFGAFNASTADSSALAMMLPAFLFRPDGLTIRRTRAGSIYAVILFTLIFIGMLRTAGSTTWFVLFAGFVGWAISTRRWSMLVFIGALILAIGGFVEKEKFLNSAGRVDTWIVLMSWWVKNANPFIGTGFGTYEWLGPISQQKTSDLFLWMHNEYLQVLYEGGAVGFSLLFCLWTTLMWRARNTPWLFSTFCAISMCMMTQFPLRFALSQIFILLVFVDAIRETGKV